MPSFVTHMMFGDAVKGKLGSSPEHKFPNTYPVAFQWGTLGPDILFSRNPLTAPPSPLGEYGSMMHKTKTAELFDEIGKYLRSIKGTTGYGAAVSYSFGFICHYCTDKNIHPYVYYTQEKMRGSYQTSAPQGIHMKLETDMDSALYALMTGKKVRHYKINPALIEAQAEMESVCEFQSHIIEKVYGKEYPPSFIKPCLINVYEREKFMFDPLFIRSYLFCRYLEVSRGEKNTYINFCRRHKIDYDVLNLKKDMWFNYENPETKRNESIPEVYEQSIDEAVKMIKDMFASVEKGKNIIFGPMPSFDYGNPEMVQMSGK